ncbi:putative NADH dehydrogenase/NAD(P)H nitroreductase [Streptomyces inusitatus]|uniref:NADH dehydrogenase/NAD(P)H nitroreductase n=1 Tax=Streptomyces inusitatus TaxID=68221 RepID=A0A918QMH9_9ACTN|nr:malonic semialdehyde reductase [Streptomyces inusitatus]GGZ59679.1 putative NADH dehydrogenase/NAD(P)H nitroreductase [Streptomyces inusitatus]
MTHAPATGLALDAAAQNLLFKEAYTTKAFAQDPVPEETIQAVHDLVKYGPTAFNQQPLRVVLVRSDEARERLLGHLSRGNRAQSETAPLIAVLGADHDFHTELPEQFPAFPEAATRFYGDPAVRERSAVFNGALQAAYFLIGVRAAGLAAGPMTGYDAEGVTKEFFPGGGHTVLAVVNIGLPAEGGAPSRGPRLGYETVFSTR